LNGLLIEILQSIPDSVVGIKLDGYYAEILQVKDNVLRTVKMWEADRQEALPFTDPE
jgi:Mg2+/Co2+ transporter CorB